MHSKVDEETSGPNYIKSQDTELDITIGRIHIQSPGSDPQHSILSSSSLTYLCKTKFKRRFLNTKNYGGTQKIAHNIVK